LTAYSCICWLFHRIYYDARNHKHKINKKIIKFINILSRIGITNTQHGCRS